MSFDKLLEELGVMAKSLGNDDGAKDDDNIQAAADEAGTANQDAAADAASDHVEPDGDEDEAGDEPMGKSFAFTLENGEVIEALDGTELVKSLMDRVNTNESQMTKALGAAIALIGQQGAMIKSLQGEMKKLAGEGRGRKAVVSVAEKVPAGQTMTKSEQPGMTPQEFFAKANAAFSAGRLSGQELTVIDVCMRSGQSIDQGLVAKVVG